MTLAEMELMTDDFITVAQAASCMHCSPQMIRDQAERSPSHMGFPISKVGHRYRIPRLGFLRWAKGESGQRLEAE